VVGSRRAFSRQLTLAFLLAAALATPARGANFSAVDEAARDAVASGEIPGAVVLLGRGTDILHHRAYGLRRVTPSQLPMTPDTIFDIASLTKPLGTTIAVMSLVERGALKLDAPLGRYLPEFDRRGLEGITIQRLLTHSAGLAAIPPTDSVRRGFPSAAARLAGLPLDYTPGASMQYSDTGFILLGEVVRRVTTTPLDRYLDRVLFTPLGLHDTFFVPPAGVRGRVAPTEALGGRMLHGEVHDPRARLLGGVAGHAGMFSTAMDVARICQMLVGGGALDGKRVLRPATVQAMWRRNDDGAGTRALGWDVNSLFSRTMAPFFPAESVGHTGFTGTAVWIDPPSGTYMVLLTNRVHPAGGGAARIRELRMRVAAAAGAALFDPSLPMPAVADNGVPASDGDEPAVPVASRGPVHTGLDVLVAQNFAALEGASVGLVTNQTGVDARGRRTIDLLAAAPRVRLQAIFSPEHGILGLANADVPHGRDAATGRPVWSLYGTTRRPTSQMLRGVNALVFDVQDVGVRYYTYLTTLIYVMEEAARHKIPLVVLDRPNPITGRVVEGPVMDADLESFTGPHPLPVRTGMTIGEFARMVAAERRIDVALTVVPLVGWERGRWFDDTGLPWVNPSPNIRSVTQALLYSGVGLLEATNLSVGRGTDVPFEVIGAPWIEPQALAAALNGLQLAGVRFEPVVFTPTDDRYAGQACGGVRLRVTDREAIRPVSVGLALGATLQSLHRAEFRSENVQSLLVNRPTMWAFLRGEPLSRVLTWAEVDRAAFLKRRSAYLIY
jgi:uncharacterized protein YbbC (DUF1343 family)/CubicO group peptidase (beta-lactamase class C family)